MTNIFIVQNNKKQLIKNLSNQKITNNKFYTISELKNEFFYSYDSKTILYLMNKYQINYQIAKIYLETLYYVDKSTYQSSKLNNLFNIKQDLLNNKMITINKLFPKFLTQSKVFFYGYFNSLDNQLLFRKLQNYTEVKEIKSEPKNYFHQIIECPSIDDEVTFVAEKIADLIKSGIDINKIFIANLNEEYYKVIKRIFPLFNIPFNIKEKNSIYANSITKEFLKSLENNPMEFLNDKKGVIPESLINILNNYAWTTDYSKVKPLIIDDIKHTYLPNEIKDNAVNEIDILNSSLKDDEYLFLLNFNQGQIPIIHKDENYLNDQELTELNLLTSIELNLIEKENAKNFLKNTKNLIITFKKYTTNATYYLSSLNDELNYEVIPMPNLSFNSSHLYNKIHLTNLLDNYLKYGTKTEELINLNTLYSNLPYNTYNNEFSNIDSLKLKEYLNNNLTLSYSTMDNFFRCGFRYYLTSILKLNIYEDTFMQTIGNIFHEVLEKSFLNETDFDTLWQNAILNTNKTFTAKEKFFLAKLKEELKYIIKTIENQNKYTSLTNELHEEKIEVKYEGELNTTFKGFIDKIKYQTINGETLVAIIDYKTGNPNTNLNNCYYGIEMQLPIYLFLAKHTPKLNNVKIAGFYLQKILNNEIIKDNIHTYNELKTKNLLLQGYSNADQSILSKFDSSYNDSQVIKGMKTSSKGFYPYSKVLDEKTINKLTDLVSNKIENAIQDITNAKFPINPKQIGKVNLGCEFCEFKDICFLKEKNIIKLKEYKNLEFLESSDNHAKMD